MCLLDQAFTMKLEERPTNTNDVTIEHEWCHLLAYKLKAEHFYMNN
jgi:hypothetical protein